MTDTPGKPDTSDLSADIEITWRGAFESAEVNALHAEAFETRVFSDDEWDWAMLCARHSLGWVAARRLGVDAGSELVGFANVPWDGFAHAWLQDVMVAGTARHRGIGVAVVHAARDAVQRAGCEHLHVDFDSDLANFYVEACGFTPTAAGLISFD